MIHATELNDSRLDWTAPARHAPVIMMLPCEI
jgi:hypothetical protein